jgi:hypothetical protein
LGFFPQPLHITTMNEDTRKLILRIQGEDLANLWTASANDKSEIDATQRVYRRQLSLLDRHLEDIRQTRIIEGAEEGAGHDVMTPTPQITDIDAHILTADGDVLRVGVSYPCREASFLPAPADRALRSIVATTARSLPQVPDRPVVCLPSSAPVAAEQLGQPTRDKHETPTDPQAYLDIAREQISKRHKIFCRGRPVRDLQRLRPSPSHAQPVEEMSIDDIFEVHDQLKVKRMMAVIPGRAISLLYKTLQDCHGSFDYAIDMILRQEEDETKVDGVDLTHSATESNSALSDAQSRSSAKEPIEAHTQTIADKSSSNPETTTTATSAIVDRNSTLVPIKPSAADTTDLKRSADHLTNSNAQPSKEQTSNIIKKEPGFEPVSCAETRAIHDQVEDLLQSFRLNQPRPTPRPEFAHNAFTGPMHVVPPKSNAIPDAHPTVMGFDISHRGQCLGGFDGPHQVDDFPRHLPQIPSALDADAFNAAPSDRQKQMIGEALYPKIHEQQPEHAGKITGMILEMDNAILFDLITDEAALRSNIDAASRVYKDYLKANPNPET